MTPDEFRKHGHDIIDFIADYRARDAFTSPGPVTAMTGRSATRAR
jgi:hypothetical protein